MDEGQSLLGGRVIAAGPREALFSCAKNLLERATYVRATPASTRAARGVLPVQCLKAWVKELTSW